jgi:hypothetical protein
MESTMQELQSEPSRVEMVIPNSKDGREKCLETNKSTPTGTKQGFISKAL